MLGVGTGDQGLGPGVYPEGWGEIPRSVRAQNLGDEEEVRVEVVAGWGGGFRVRNGDEAEGDVRKDEGR